MTMHVVNPAMDWIDVSPEMISLIGRGRVGEAPWPSQPVALSFDFGGDGMSASFRFDDAPTRPLLDEARGTMRLILIVARTACSRILGGEMPLVDGGTYHLPAALRAIAIAIRDCALPEAARTPYRLAKSIELLCETLQLIDGDLVPMGHDGTLSRLDGQRVLAARRMIDERCAEKLTLDMIARACGLNRAKLTRGFRDLFDCSVADAIAADRLGRARQMLVATDMPVASIGYRCGYLNNASFARAFSRHFGVAPTLYRAQRLAA